MQSFSDIRHLSSELLSNLDTLGYKVPTEIQALTIPFAMDGNDILAKAKTGSGKTAAFGIPIIEKLNTDTKEPQTLIITPTRELAMQVATELRKVARYKRNIKVITLTGGVPMRGQIESLEQGAHIVIGTPGRLQDHLSRDTLPLFEITTLVLDEADRMMDMGFYDAIKKIISNIRTKKQTMFFSATYPDKIEQLSKSILKNPKLIITKDKHTHEHIKQVAYQVGLSKKNKELLHILQSKRPKSCLIFANMKIETEDIADFLYDNGFFAQALNGNLSQIDRNQTLLMFANGTIPTLVATDVASRGLDVKDIDLVVNYDLPNDSELYVHRIGRTGRAGSHGEAITLYTQNQKHNLSNIAPDIEYANISDLRADSSFALDSQLNTLCIDGGKKNRLRAGDILGALCKDIGIDGASIGKIDIHDTQSYIALDSKISNKALKGIRSGKIKNRKFRAWLL